MTGHYNTLCTGVHRKNETSEPTEYILLNFIVNVLKILYITPLQGIFKTEQKFYFQIQSLEKW